MAQTRTQAPTTATQAQAPRGINHVVLNVRDLEVSHRFWTEIIGFKCVAQLKQTPGRPRPKMRFYSGVDAHGEVTHHDLALAEVPADAPRDERGTWSLMPGRVGINHVAIAWPDRESWLKQLEHLQSKGVTFHRRVNHGMTHSVYISDPDGNDLELAWDRPMDEWPRDEQGHVAMAMDDELDVDALIATAG